MIEKRGNFFMNTIRKTLNENWRFHLGDCEPAWYKGFDDASWQEVSLPHDWSVTLPFEKGNSSGTGYVSGGIGWYRMRFLLPEEFRGKSVRLVFDGVYKNSQVWCNSYYLGKRPNGYVSFSYDITPFVCFGDQDNEVSVKVTHTDLADSRWFTGSGITRSVHVDIAEPVHPAQDSIFFEAEEANENRARLKVTQELVNGFETDKRVDVRTVLVDMEGRTVWETAGSVEVRSAHGMEVLETQRGIVPSEYPGAKLVLEKELDRPHLWSDEDPYLYKLRTEYSVDGEDFYRVSEIPVGIRSFRFDADRGFFLNEKPMKLKGVCVHHDGGCLGAAMTKEVWRRRLLTLRECGCNAIRCSHNPHMPELYELCDELGFLMMDEAFDEWENPKNKWSTGHNVYPPRHQGYFEDFPQWHEVDLKAMVRRDRNHPSVIMWSIGNEIDYPNDPYCHPMFETMTGNNDADKPVAERTYDMDKPNAQRLSVLAARLAKMVRQEDKSRPVTLAAAFPELSSRIGFLDALDVAGYNYKEHLYEEDHKRFPGLPFLGSENGHSYDAWRAVRDNDYISGQFLWTGIDYLGEAHGWPIRGSQAGLLTCAGDRKAEFYKRCSFWKNEPVLHISSRPGTIEEYRSGKRWIPFAESWNYAAGEPVIVRCASNAFEVVLYRNGKEIGRQQGCNEEGTFDFDTVFESGKLMAEAYDENGVLVQTAELSTAGRAVRLECGLWEDDGEKDRSQTAGYLYQISMELKDDENVRASSDDRRIEIQVSGAGELAGLENGNLSDVTPYKISFRSTWEGRLTAYVRRRRAGKIHILVRTELAGGVYEDEITVD